MAVDATRPTDNDAITDWPAFIRAIAALANANAAAVGGDYSRTVSAQNTSTTFTAGDLNQIYTVNSASAVTLTLPAVTADNSGDWIRVHKLSSGDLTVTAGGSDVIATGGAGSQIANTEAAEPKAAFIELEVTAAGQWMIAGMLGTWTLT